MCASIGRLARLFTLVGFAALLFVTAGAAKPFPPFDEARGNPEFMRFREELLSVARARDLSRLRAMMHPDIVTSFGGSGGIEEAVQAFREDPDRWQELAAVLALGGGFENPGTFIAPYTFFAEGDDPFLTGAVIGESVNVRSEPSDRGRVVGRLSHETVELAGDDPYDEPGWVRVRMPDGATGYVDARFIRSPVDYRAIFRKEGGGWLLEAFIAGD